MTGNAIRCARPLWIGVFVALALSTTAWAATTVTKEAATAADHAGFAAKAATIQQVHMHLHHVLNCLVGPKGTGFDLDADNPCGAIGNGAIPDATAAAAKTTLESAVKSASAGLATNDLTAARKDAAETETTLRKLIPGGM